jgi:DHA1 family bicyclomycin/chloramphenicol resistance-like MFS transporter
MTAAVAALVLLASAWSGIGGLVGLLVPLWVILASCGLTFPNTPALALSRHGEAAGTAAALLGAAQFAIGGLAAPVIGLLGSGSGIPMAAVMATTATLAAVVAARTLRVHVVTS